MRCGEGRANQMLITFGDVEDGAATRDVKPSIEKNMSGDMVKKFLPYL